MNRFRKLALAAALAGSQVEQAAVAVEGARYTDDARFTASTEVPQGGLVVGADGRFYGLASSFITDTDEGTIYRYEPGGEITVVHRFIGYPHGDEGRPVASLIRMPDDSLWGITFSGGEHSGGTVFRFDPASGKTEVVHSFDISEGNDPFGRLLLASDGYVYGTTSQYGRYDGGSIFRIDPATRSYATLWFFGSQRKLGRSPGAGLTEGPDGRLYGSTNYGLDAAHAGSLFAFDPVQRRMSLLVQFPRTAGDTDQEVTLSPAGLIYGVTRESESGCGTVYSIRPDGRGLRTRHTFDCVHGNQPSGPLLLASDGFLYGPLFRGPMYRLRPDVGAGTFSILQAGGRDRATAAFESLVESNGALWGVASYGSGIEPLSVIFDLRPESE